MKLTRRHKNVLRALADANGGVRHDRLPDGNGHAAGGHYASHKTLSELKGEDLVKYHGEAWLCLYVITEAGRAILSDLHAERAKP